MRILQLENVESGMVLARSVSDAQGNLLLASGVELNDAYIARLEAVGVVQVCIVDEAAAEVEVTYVVSEAIRARTVHNLRRAFGRETNVNMAQISAVVDSLVESIMNSPAALIHLQNIKRQHDLWYQHSIDTCCLMVAFGISLGFRGKQLKELATGMLLHDIGLAIMPPGSSAHPDEAEFQQRYQLHPEWGWQLLKQNPEISAVSRAVVLQHHERWDGSGFPQRLKGDQISDAGQIGGLVNLFDSWTTDRPERPAVKPFQVIEYLLESSGHHFNVGLVKAFTSKVPAFPPGTTIRLSSDDTGVVVGFNPELPLRPWVKLLGRDQVLDLSKEPHLIITEIL